MHFKRTAVIIINIVLFFENTENKQTKNEKIRLWFENNYKQDKIQKLFCITYRNCSSWNSRNSTVPFVVFININTGNASEAISVCHDFGFWSKSATASSLKNDCNSKKVIILNFSLYLSTELGTYNMTTTISLRGSPLNPHAAIRHRSIRQLFVLKKNQSIVLESYRFHFMNTFTT